MNTDTVCGFIDDVDSKKTKFCYNYQGDGDIHTKMSMLEFKAIRLKPKSGMSLEDALFSAHTTFKKNSNVVIEYTGDTTSLSNFCSLLDLRCINLFYLKLPTINLMLQNSYRGRVGTDESIDANILKDVLFSWQCMMANDDKGYETYRELGLESHTQKHLVGGDLDIVVTSKKNCKPSFKMEYTNDRTPQVLYCRALSESKAPCEPLTEQPLQTFTQPVLQTLAFSSCCTPAADPSFPLIQVYGNRHRFRPIIYFMMDDVMLTTKNPVQYGSGEKGMGIAEGMYVLFLLLHSGRFSNRSITNFEKTEWRDLILSKNNPYLDTKLKPQQRQHSNEAIQNLQSPIYMSQQVIMAETLSTPI